jgi:xanthine dehydrogenase accessory factor
MSSHFDFFERIARMGREGRSFAVATVVGRRAPVSAHLGDRAIIFADGRMEGFVGGACSHEIVRTQALEVLASGRGRIVSIQPDAGSAESGPDRVVVPMTCASEGAVDVYIEPFVRARLLVVVGATPIAGALARVARSLDYRVVRVVDVRERADIESDAVSFGFTVATLDTLDDLLKRAGAGQDDRAVVVASQGHYDEEALAAALKGGVPYVGLVASRTRGATVKALLEEQGVPGVTTLRNPAGLDLGARTAPEVALSILAEIVQARSSQSRVEPASTSAPVVSAAPSIAIDPVCHMQVDVLTARHTADLDGVTYYFCCAGCKARFLKQPHDYLSRTP